jgi:hypothetical protein
MTIPGGGDAAGASSFPPGGMGFGDQGALFY